MSAPPLAARDSDVEIPVRGEALWRLLESPLAAAETGLGRWLPERWNPLLQAGAIANTSLMVAIGSGVLLLIWYTPSVGGAHASVAAMDDLPLAGLVRAVHRYSSDATVAFGAWHGLRLALARRFTGPRWLAWVTGLGLMAALGLVGWLGYWLLWDDAARQVALGTARLADALPLFAEPLSRSFLVDELVNSLLFFVVFFVHMLLPLPMALLLWLHIGRVARSRFFPFRGLAAVVLIGTFAVSAALAPGLGAPATMTSVPDRILLDAWFLWPVALTDRGGAGALWALILGGGTLALAAPWLLARGKVRVAVVNESRCHSCTLCTIDCPYDAIVMAPRTDGKPGLVAQVDLNKCTGCGICAGSCDSAAIGLDAFPVLSARQQIDAWLDSDPGPAPIVLVCGSSGVPVSKGASAGYPGARVMAVPCSGWIHPLTVERALKHGATEVTVVTCGEGQCRYREGSAWIRERLAGQRQPALRSDKVDARRVRVVAAASRWPAVGAAAIVGILAAVVLGSAVPYAIPGGDAPELIVSFVHPGEADERCRAPSVEEQAALPIHMRAAEICERARPDVRLRVSVDGTVVREARIAAGGLWGDGASVALERIPVPAGAHTVAVAIGDQADGSWTWEEEREVTFEARDRRVVLFDRRDGFTWHPSEAP